MNDIGFKYIKSGYEGDAKYLKVYPIGDIHLGSPHFNYKYLMKVLERIAQDRENSRIIIMGDVAETATKRSVGAGVYEQVMTPQQQIKRAAEIFEPFKDLIDGVVTGNHELRLYKDDAIDLMEMFADKLGIADKYLGYSGVISYAWNKRNYDVYVWHGAGGGSKPGGSLNRLEEQVKVVQADVYLMGHVHKKIAYKKDVYVCDSRNMKLTKREQMFIITGSSLEWAGSYAQMVGLPPATAGYPHFILGGRIVGGKKIREMSAVI